MKLRIAEITKWLATAAALGLGVVGAPRSAFACPFCAGEGGRNLVKEEIFQAHFWYFGFATALPMALCLCIGLWINDSPVKRRATESRPVPNENPA
jgi:hypothetical protein